MSVTQQGSINTTALIVPNAYIQIVPPQVTLLNGNPTNILGVVGTASWGPKNSPTIIGSMADYSRQFGAIQARKYDMGTAVAAAVLQGANNFRCVRVTDTTDVAASITMLDTTTPTAAIGLTVTSKYTGSLANADTVTIANGSVANSSGTSYKVTVARAGMVPEVFDNITQSVASATIGAGGTGYTTAPTVTFSAPTLPGGVTATGIAVLTAGAVSSITITNPGSGYATGATPTIAFSGGGGTGATATAVISVWTLMANAINNGQGGVRGPSQLIVASASAITTTPALATRTLTGGTDGAVTIVDTTHMVGSDTMPRSGMYALRNTGASVAFLADCDNTATFTNQVAFGLSEGVYMIGVTPLGDGSNITTAVSTKSSAGIDSYTFKYLLGDWVYFNDTVNNQTRLISPQGFVAGLLSNLSPEQSSLNKQLYGIVGTQKSNANQQYSDAELQILGQAGIDVVTNPVPGGSYFGARFGHNSSSNPVINGDNYVRMTNYIAYTLNAGLGKFVGKLQGRGAQDPTRRSAKATLDAFFENMRTPNSLTGYGMIDDFSVQLDKTNNSDSRIALGYMQADVKVVYLSVVEKFLVNMEGGQSVSVVRQSVQLA